MHHPSTSQHFLAAGPRGYALGRLGYRWEVGAPGWKVLESHWECSEMPLKLGIFFHKVLMGSLLKPVPLEICISTGNVLARRGKQWGAGVQDAVSVPREGTLQALQGLCPHSKSHLAYLSSSAASPHSLCPHPSLRRRRPEVRRKVIHGQAIQRRRGHKVVCTGHDSNSLQSCAVACACSTHCSAPALGAVKPRAKLGQKNRHHRMVPHWHARAGS